MDCQRCKGKGEVPEWVGTWAGVKSSPMLARKISRWVRCPECNPRDIAPVPCGTVID